MSLSTLRVLSAFVWMVAIIPASHATTYNIATYHGDFSNPSPANVDFFRALYFGDTGFVTGYITTNGRTGPLSVADITDYSITFTTYESTSFTYTFTPANSVVSLDSFLTATPLLLTYDFSSARSSQTHVLFESRLTEPEEHYCLGVCGFTSFQEEVLFTRSFDSDPRYSRDVLVGPPQVIAAIPPLLQPMPVSEPGLAALVAVGLMAGSMNYRNRRRRSDNPKIKWRK